jgi:ribokinase
MSAPVVIVGSLNADLFVEVAALPRPGETVRGSDLTVRPGGKGANQAAAAGLLGADVTMIGAVGADDHGRLLLSAAASAGVRTEVIRTVDVATGTAMITVDGQGENTIIVSAGANALLSRDDARAGIQDRTVVVGLCLEIGAETVSASVARAKEVGATVVLNLSPFRRVEPGVLAGVDVLLVNEIELGQLVGAFDDLDQARSRLADAGIGRAVVTLGDAGAAILDADGPTIRRIASPRVEVVDTTGCGDAFAGALITRLAAGDELDDAVITAVLVGAYAATGRGAQPSYPTAQQLAAWAPVTVPDSP